MPHADRLRGPAPNRRGLILLGLAVALAILCGVSMLGSSRYVVVNRFLDQPLALGSGAAVLLAWAVVCVLQRPAWVGFLLAAGALGLGGLYLGAGLVLTSSLDGHDEARSPTGDYEAVTDEGFGIIDPIWHVTIRQSHGLLARQWEIGCDESISQVRWDGPDTLRLLGGDEESGFYEVARVKVDPSSGRPLGKSPLRPC